MQAAVIAADAVAEILVFLEDALGVIDSITAGLCQFQVVFVANKGTSSSSSSFFIERVSAG